MRWLEEHTIAGGYVELAAAVIRRARLDAAAGNDEAREFLTLQEVGMGRDARVYYVPNQGSHPNRAAGYYHPADVERMEEERQASAMQLSAERVKKADKVAEAKRQAEEAARQRIAAERGQQHEASVKARLRLAWRGDDKSFERAWPQLRDEALTRDALAADDARQREARQYIRARF